MKFFRIDLLTLLISLFILGSCKNPDGIGLPVDPSRALNTGLIDTATINTVTVPDDSVSTSNLPNVPLAFFRDPVLGTTEANIATALNLPFTTAYVLPVGNTTIDSVVLVMKYADGFYGDSLTTNYKVNVYQLSEPVVTTKTYFNTKAWTTKPGIIGTATFVPRPKTKVVIKDIVTGAKDTDIHVKPQLRVRIDTAFIRNNFFNATASQLATNSVFQNAVKGLYLTLDQSKPGVGGNIYFNMALADTSASTLDVYFHTNNAGTIDTTHLSLGLGTPHAAQIKHNYSTAVADLNTQLTHPNASYNTLYVQGLSGLRAKISFPYLKQILATQGTGGDVVLNSAELVVTPVTGTTIPYAPTPRLTMYRYDIARQRQLIPDAYAGDLHYIAVGSFGGFYDASHRSYHYVITGYIEDLMRGKLVDYGTYIAVADTVGVTSGNATIDISNTPAVAARAVLGGDKTSVYKMKLNIIYNKVTK